MANIDSRVFKTRRKLKRAFLTLIEFMPLKEIIVKDLINLADITRGTFYRHYKDKGTFIQTMMEECLAEFFERVMINVSRVDEEPVYICSLLKIFEYVAEQPNFFSLLLKEEKAVHCKQKMREEFHHYMAIYIKNRTELKRRQVPEKIWLSFFISAFLGVIQTWLMEDMVYGHRYMARNLYKLLNSQFLHESGMSTFFVIDYDY